MKAPGGLNLRCIGNAGDVGDMLVNQHQGASPPENAELGTVGTGRNGSCHGPLVPIAPVKFGDGTCAINSQALPNVPNVPCGRRGRGDE
jgi:hypothetical protein